VSHCRDCGQEIVWGQDEQGRRMPLDRGADVYRLLQWDAIAQKYAVTKVQSGYYVDHRSVCPKRKRRTAARPASSRSDPRRAASGE